MPLDQKPITIDVEITDEVPLQDTVVRYELPLSKLIPKKIHEALEGPMGSIPDSKLMREAQPDSLDWRLRLRYSQLFRQLTDPMAPLNAIRLEDLYSDLCTYEVLKRRLEIPAKAVFIARRMGSFLEDSDALINAFSARLWEIASAPILSDKGKLDIETTKIIHKTIQILLDRKFGQAVQRQISVNAELPIDPSAVDPGALEAQIKELEAMSERVQAKR